MAAAGLMFALLWWSTNSGGRLVERPLLPPYFRRAWLRVLWIPAVFLLSIPLALGSPDAAKYTWLLIMLPLFWHPDKKAAADI